uniref:Uncharacterized protein n=1 Tax=Candidatus Kentrum sp. UNK TaxID=2126344 RepID=A0A451A4C0_9GAMM|nr:MAG: hypothetical protein BECKUNK1418G_GA0071005_101414 [Candidatus Kentron sp. UNK]
MALDTVPGINGMAYPCQDDGIVEFRFDFQVGVCSNILFISRSVSQMSKC